MITYLIIILYNLLDMITIPLVGQLKLSEVIVLMALPFYYKSNEFSKYNILGKIVISLLLLLIFQSITDILAVGSSSIDYLRGWSQTIIAMASVLFLFKILNSYKAITLFIIISFLRPLLSEPLGVNVDSSEMVFFKFRVAPALTQLIYALAILLHSKERYKVIPLLFLLFGLLNVAMDSRSRGLIMILSAILLHFSYTEIKIRRSFIVIGVIAMIVGFQILYSLYVTATLNGSIGGEHSKVQLERLENPYNPFSLLATGRGEVFAAVEAIKDAPMFGHGSWAKDHTLKYYRIILKYHNEEFDEMKARIDAGLIPSHSIILGSWVNYGVLAFLAVMYLFSLLIKMALPLIRRGQAMPIYPIFIPMTLSLIWMFMFSPFQQLRFNVPQMAAIFLTAYYLLQKREMPAEPEPPEHQEQFPTGNMAPATTD